MDKLTLLEQLKQNLEAAVIEATEGRVVRPRTAPTPTKPNTPEPSGHIMPRPTNGEAVVLNTPEQLEELKAVAAAFYKTAAAMDLSFALVSMAANSDGEPTHLCAYRLGKKVSNGVGSMILALDPLYALTGKKEPVPGFLLVE